MRAANRSSDRTAPARGVHLPQRTNGTIPQPTGTGTLQQSNSLKTSKVIRYQCCRRTLAAVKVSSEPAALAAIRAIFYLSAALVHHACGFAMSAIEIPQFAATSFSDAGFKKRIQELRQ